jgi:hypothetical protein
MVTHSASATLLDGTPVDCEFEVIEHGSAGNMWDDPGEGSIVGVESAEMEDGTLVLLTDEERDALELQIAAQVDSDPYFFAFDD